MAVTKSRLPIKLEPVKARIAKSENQGVFWFKLGVTQSGGSRYESGRDMPRPLRMLMALAEGKATIEQLKSGELAARV